MAVPDLCEMSAKKDPCLQELAAGPVKIAACYPRRVEWLFAAAKAPLPKEGTQVLNMRTETADAIVKELLAHSSLSPLAPGGEGPGVRGKAPTPLTECV